MRCIYCLVDSNYSPFSVPQRRDLDEYELGAVWVFAGRVARLAKRVVVVIDDTQGLAVNHLQAFDRPEREAEQGFSIAVEIEWVIDVQRKFRLLPEESRNNIRAR